jgi:succinate-semialdehyde dehydrogenase/glutarate-semialdehyde dehydrogenase
MGHAYGTDLTLFIDGERLGTTGRATHRVVNPATGETLGELPLATPADLERALDAAARGYRRWRGSSAAERSRVLAGAARLLRERIAEIAAIATLEEGKTLVEARAEVMMAAGLFDFYAGEVTRVYGRVLVRPAGTLSRVMKEPVGPVAAFCPWNFPIGNPARKLGAAIGAGCSIIISRRRRRRGRRSKCSTLYWRQACRRMSRVAYSVYPIKSPGICSPRPSFAR